MATMQKYRIRSQAPIPVGDAEGGTPPGLSLRGMDGLFHMAHGTTFPSIVDPRWGQVDVQAAVGVRSSV